MAPGAAPPKPPPKPASALLAVARIELATTVPLEAVSPWTITVSPGWIALAPETAVRVTFPPLPSRTRTVLPLLSST